MGERVGGMEGEREGGEEGEWGCKRRKHVHGFACGGMMGADYRGMGWCQRGEGNDKIARSSEAKIKAVVMKRSTAARGGMDAGAVKSGQRCGYG